MTAGRKSDYSEETADEIVMRLGNGESLSAICMKNTMPSRQTVINWQHQRPDFFTKCARARQQTADLMDEKIMDVIEKVETGDLAPDVARVMLAGIQWRAAKLDPKKYGEQKGQDVTVNLHNHLAITEERMEQLRQIKRESIARQGEVKKLGA